MIKHANSDTIECLIPVKIFSTKLRMNGIHTVGDLLKESETSLLKKPGIGRRLVQFVLAMLELDDNDIRLVEFEKRVTKNLDT